jgi:hypothetical protein
MIGLWAKLKIGLGIAGAVIVAIGIAFLRGRAAGTAVIDADQEKRRLEAVKHRTEIDDEVDQMGAADVDRNYARWLRDNER